MVKNTVVSRKREAVCCSAPLDSIPQNARGHIAEDIVLHSTVSSRQWRAEGRGVQTPSSQKFRRPSIIVPNSTRL